MNRPDPVILPFAAKRKPIDHDAEERAADARDFDATVRFLRDVLGPPPVKTPALAPRVLAELANGPLLTDELLARLGCVPNLLSAVLKRLHAANRVVRTSARSTRQGPGKRTTSRWALPDPAR